MVVRLALVGASGSGKTTLFRALAGFMDISAGQISVGNRLVSQPGLTLNPERRGVGLVFQDLALFPHMTVERNIRYGLRGLSATEASRRVDELLELTDCLRCAMPCPRPSPAASSSGWRWRGRWRRVRGCCCSTSPSPASIWKPGCGCSTQ